MQPGLLDELVSRSVDINGLLVPGRSIEGVLARHAFNLFINNSDDETYKVQLLGSATAIRYRGREILLTTQHQIRDIDPSQVSMLTDNGGHLITCNGCRHYSPSTETDANDVVAFDFSEPCKKWLELRRRFFNLNPQHHMPQHDDGSIILLSGYIFKEQTYEIHENNHLGLVRRNIVCRLHSQPSDLATLKVEAFRPIDKDPDGMSGGSAFAIQMHNGHPRAYFSGIIIRGSPQYFTILRGDVIMAFLDTVFELTPS